MINTNIHNINEPIINNINNKINNKTNNEIIDLTFCIENDYKIFGRKHFYYLSALLLLNSAYGFYKGVYDVALLVGLVFTTSIIYWNDPEIGLRRYIDNIAVFALILYIYTKIRNKKNNIKYFIIFSLIVLCSFIFYYYKINKRNIQMALYSHIIIHLLANLSFIILYNDKNVIN